MTLLRLTRPPRYDAAATTCSISQQWRTWNHCSPALQNHHIAASCRRGGTMRSTHAPMRLSVDRLFSSSATPPRDRGVDQAVAERERALKKERKAAAQALSFASENLDAASSALKTLTAQQDWTRLRTELSDLRAELDAADEIWTNDPDRAVECQRRIARLDDTLRLFESFSTRLEEARDVVALASEEGDSELAAVVGAELETLEAEISKYSLMNLMSDPADKGGCFIEIKAGSGGLEAFDWSATVLRMYQRWGAAQSYEVSVVEESKAEVGIRSATLYVVGDYAYGWCKYESGVHRFVRLAKFSEPKRQTSFVGVQVLPCGDPSSTTSAKDIDLPPSDLKIEAMRAQGAGGQHVNKTESAIRLTHLPTGIVVFCQNDRSQAQNKATAFQMLRAKLYQREVMAQAQVKAAFYADLPENAWGNQIRSYVTMPYQMVKDLRTGYERSDIDNVLDGDLEGFMQASVLHFKRKDE